MHTNSQSVDYTRIFPANWIQYSDIEMFVQNTPTPTTLWGHEEVHVSLDFCSRATRVACSVSTCVLYCRGGCQVHDDVLDWWRWHPDVFLALAKLGKNILPVLASSAESKRNFSATGMLTKKHWARLGADNLWAMPFMNKNRTVLTSHAASVSSNTTVLATRKWWASLETDPEEVLLVELQDED